MRVAIYVRVSTIEQARDGYSVQEQIDSLKLYCKAMKWIVVNVYTDAGHSGANTDRPALQDMIKDIEKGLIDKVLVYKLDRLSRSQKDTLELIEDVFLVNNTDFVSMNENFDTSTSFGRAMIGILAVFAQLEREQIKERMCMGREGRAKDGKFHGGGYIPIGYDYIDGELVINQFEALQIQEIHKLYQQGNAFNKICGIFAEKGYRHKHGKWQTKRVKECMMNDLYIGNVHFSDQVFKGTHTPIIDEETFKKSLAIYQSKDYSNYKNHGRTSYLGSLIYCKHCEARYTATSYTTGGKKYRYYSCHSRRKISRSMIKNPNCKNKNYTMENLDNLIFDEIRKLSNDTSYIRKLKERNLSDDIIEKEKLLRKEIEKLNDQKSRFTKLYGLGEYTIEEVQKEVAPLNEQKKKIEKEIENLNKGKATLSEEEAIKIVNTFEDVMQEGDFNQIRLLINSLIDRVVIDEEDMDIYWKFA